MKTRAVGPVISGSLLAVVVVQLTVNFVLESRLQRVPAPSGYEKLEPCAVRQLTVSELDGDRLPGCNLAGSSVEFPSGRVVKVPEVEKKSRARGKSGNRLRVDNWGIPGISATRVNSDGEFTIWATTEWARSLRCESIGNDRRYDLDEVDACPSR